MQLHSSTTPLISSPPASDVPFNVLLVLLLPLPLLLLPLLLPLLLLPFES